MKAEVLYVPGCPNLEPARRQVERLLAELGASVPGAGIEVVDRNAASRLQFIGSPTIRIDGEDVAISDSSPALACRIYVIGDELSGIPSDDVVRVAIRRSLERSGKS